MTDVTLEVQPCSEPHHIEVIIERLEKKEDDQSHQRVELQMEHVTPGHGAAWLASTFTSDL
jgi:hypothetical protein